MPLRVGPVESKAGRVRCFGLRAGSYSGRYPVAVSLRREVVGDIDNCGGEGRGVAGGDTGARGGDEPEHDSKEPVGPIDKEGTTFQQPGSGRGCHVAGATCFERKA